MPEDNETLTNEQEDTKEVEETPKEQVKEEPDEETQQALKLYNALKNPESAKIVIETLAKQLGLIQEQQKEEPKVPDTLEQLREILGPELAGLADKLAPAIEFIVNQRVSDLKNQISQSEEARIKQEVEDSLDYLRRITKGESKKYEPRMVELMDEVLPGPNVRVRDYLMKLYRIAAAEDAERTAKKRVATRIQSNSADVISRLTSLGTIGKTPEIPKKPMKLDDAIQFAMKALEQTEE